MNEGRKIVDYLRGSLDSSNIVLGPSSSNMFKINNVYNVLIVIKYKKTDDLVDKLDYINSRYVDNKDVLIDIDLNPYKI
jgi:primosomal protein N'